MHLTIDFETRSPSDIKKEGTWKYAENPFTEVMCLAVAQDMGPARLWVPYNFEKFLTTEITISKQSLIQLIKDADTIEAHNVEFEIAIWFHIMQGLGFPDLPMDKMRCSAAKAAIVGIPRSLGKACKALNLAEQKDEAGSKVMQKMCKPKKPTKSELKTITEMGWTPHPTEPMLWRLPDGTESYFWNEKPEDMTSLFNYCLQDVVAERALSKATPELSPYAYRLWRVDQEINRRGVLVDHVGCLSMIQMSDTYKAKINSEIQRLTDGEITKGTQVAQISAWLSSKGIQTCSLDAEAIDVLLTDGLPEDCHRLLELRREYAKSSVAKYEAADRRMQKDGRVRSMFMYHGAHTGRWAGKGVQLQNLPSRGLIKNPEAALELIKNGCSIDMLSLIWESPLKVASSCIRSVFLAAEGHEYLCVDYSAIEGRILAWLAGEQYVLDGYIAKLDPYKVAAAGAFQIDYASVNKAQRQIGKVIELACIAEDQEVLTDRGLVKIQEVLITDKVWDGLDFVSHGGVIYKGEKEVLAYEGLRATNDHLVWVEGECGPIRFLDAATSGKRIVQSGSGGCPIRVGGDYIPGEEIPKGVDGLLRSRQVCQLSQGIVGCAKSSGAPEDQGLPKMFSTETDTQVVRPAHYAGQSEMLFARPCSIRGLRRAGDKIQLQRSAGVWPLHIEYVRRTTTAQRIAVRQDRQQRALRSRKYQVCDPASKPREQTMFSHGSVESERMALLSQRSPSQTGGGENTKTNNPTRQRCGKTQAQELAGDRTKVSVYDILNCGPRNRFTVSGKLVHNCGYQGWLGAFHSMAKNYGLELADDVVKETILKWRAARPLTVRLWAEVQKAAELAMLNPGKTSEYRNIQFRLQGQHLQCRLPSGRILWYPFARIKDDVNQWGKPCYTISYMTEDSVTNQWCRKDTYGGKICENVVQAISADIISNALILLAEDDWHVVMHIHDEVVSEEPIGKRSVEEMAEIMCRLPKWADGLPITAEGWKGPRYKKEE